MLLGVPSAIFRLSLLVDMSDVAMALQSIDAGDIDYILVHHDLQLAARSADRIQLVATTAGNVIVRRQVVFKSCPQQRTTFLPLLLGSDDLMRANVNELDSLELSGAGGTLALPAYQVPSLVAKFGGSCARVKDLAILTEATGLPNEFYGTIGESALSSFSSFTLDFHAMHFSVNGGNPGDCTDSVTLASSERRGKSAR